VEVGGGHGAEVLGAGRVGDARRDVDRDELDGVQQQDPDEHRQRQRGDEAAVAVEDIADLGIDELDGQLDEGLQLAGHAGGGATADPPEQAQAEDADGQRHQQGIDVDGPEATRTDLHLQVLKMVGDVFAGAVTGDLQESIHRSNQGRLISCARVATTAPPRTYAGTRPWVIASTRPAPMTPHLSTVPRSRRPNCNAAGAVRDLSSVRQAKTNCAAAITTAPVSVDRPAFPPCIATTIAAAMSPKSSWNTGSVRARGETGGDARF